MSTTTRLLERRSHSKCRDLISLSFHARIHFARQRDDGGAKEARQHRRQRMKDDEKQLSYNLNDPTTRRDATMCRKRAC